MTPREKGSQCNEPAKPKAPARRRAPRLRCTPECRVCVVALVRGEVCAGTLARRTPPHWDGALDSALGKSFTTRPIHHALWSGRGVEGRARARAIGTIQGQIQAPVRRSSRDGLQRLVQPLAVIASRRAPPSGMTDRPAARRRAAAADVGSVPRKNGDPPLGEEDNGNGRRRSGNDRRERPSKVQRIKDTMDKYVHIRGQVTIIKKLAAIRNTREGAKASKRHIRYIQNPDGAHLYSYSNIPVPQEVHALHANDPYARSDMCAQVTYQHIHERALKEEAILTMLAAAHAGSSAAQRNVASHRQGQIAIAGATTAGDAGHKRAPQLRGIHVAALAGRGSRKAHHPTPPATPPRGRHRTARRAPHTSMRPALQRDSTPRTGATMGKTTEQQRGNIAALAALTGMAATTHSRPRRTT